MANFLVRKCQESWQETALFFCRRYNSVFSRSTLWRLADLPDLPIRAATHKEPGLLYWRNNLRQEVVMLAAVTGTVSDLLPGMEAALAKYRYQVFVKELGWPLPCEKGIELDAFDRSDTVYVLACNDNQCCSRITS